MKFSLYDTFPIPQGVILPERLCTTQWRFRESRRKRHGRGRHRLCRGRMTEKSQKKERIEGRKARADMVQASPLTVTQVTVAQ